MTRRLCPQCDGLLDVESVGSKPARLVSFCEPCNLVVTRTATDVPADYPRSSSDRTEAR